MILAGDIGGTKTHLALYESSGKLKSIHEEKYLSGKYQSLEQIVAEYVASQRVKVEKACFGIAGPIRDGRCQATNLPWVVESKELAKELKTSSVWLINDLEANAWGIRCLDENEFVVLNEGEKGNRGNGALISAGTGLGEAGLYWDGTAYHPFGCEGGHADFSRAMKWRWNCSGTSRKGMTMSPLNGSFRGLDCSISTVFSSICNWKRRAKS